MPQTKLTLSGSGKRFLVVNHRPELDPSKHATTGFDDRRRAVRFAQNLNSPRVDVIDANMDKYIIQYPLEAQ